MSAHLRLIRVSLVLIFPFFTFLSSCCPFFRCAFLGWGQVCGPGVLWAGCAYRQNPALRAFSWGLLVDPRRLPKTPAHSRCRVFPPWVTLLNAGSHREPPNNMTPERRNVAFWMVLGLWEPHWVHLDRPPRSRSPSLDRFSHVFKLFLNVLLNISFIFTCVFFMFTYVLLHLSVCFSTFLFFDFVHVFSFWGCFSMFPMFMFLHLCLDCSFVFDNFGLDMFSCCSLCSSQIQTPK